MFLAWLGMARLGMATSVCEKYIYIYIYIILYITCCTVFFSLM